MQTFLKETFSELIGNAIVQAGRSIKVHSLKIFSSNNIEITPGQFMVLSQLNDDLLLHQNKLCERLYKDKSNMARILSVLEEKGLIEKIPTKECKHVNKIKITEKGKELKIKFLPIVQQYRDFYLSNISEDDMYTCIKVLSKIHENLTEKEEE